MDETYKEKAAFICWYSTLQFEFMRLGFMNSQANFQRMIGRILLRVNNVRCYADDVMIFSGNKEEHLKHLENVFAILKENGLRLRFKKCSFKQLSA